MAAPHETGDAVVERCAQFWGDAYERASYAAGVAQHVADDQRASQRFLDARQEQARAAAAAVAVQAAAAPPPAEAARARARADAAPPRASAGELSVESLLAQARLLRAEQARRGEEGAAKPHSGHAAAASTVAGRGRVVAARPITAAAAAPGASASVAAPPAALSVVVAPPPPLALPEALQAASARLSAAGVAVGTTLTQFLDAQPAQQGPAGGAAFAQRLTVALGGADAAAHAPPPPDDAPLPYAAAQSAAAQALEWELEALEGSAGGGVDWAAAQDVATPPLQLCTAAHTLGHVLRLHAAVRACLSAAEGDRAAALRWRDALLAALLPPATDDLAEEAEGPPAHSPPEAWLPPHAWPRLPGGAPAALWPAGSDVPMSYTSAAELAALAAARLELQEAALDAHFEAVVGAPLAAEAARCAAALPPPFAAGADAALEAHAEACRLAHALLLRGAPGQRGAAVIARRQL